MNEEELQNRLEYDLINSRLAFAWMCGECHNINYINEEEHHNKNGLDECIYCDTAYFIKKPWS